MSELIIKKRQAVFVFRVEDIVYMEKNLRKIRLHAKMCGWPQEFCRQSAINSGFTKHHAGLNLIPV